MTCKDCIHYGTCYGRMEFELTAETECKDFKDKFKFIESPCVEKTLREEIECLLIDESVKQRMLEKLNRIDERFKEIEVTIHELRLENSNLYDKIHYYRGALILLAKETPNKDH